VKVLSELLSNGLRQFETFNSPSSFSPADTLSIVCSRITCFNQQPKKKKKKAKKKMHGGEAK